MKNISRYVLAASLLAGVLLAVWVLLVNFRSHERVRPGSTLRTMNDTTLAIDAFQLEHGRLPGDLQALLRSTETTPLADETQNDLLDEWEHPIRYTHSAVEYELRSAGPDGVFRTGDDIVRSHTTRVSAGHKR